MSKYSKFIAAVVGAATLAGTLATDGYTVAEGVAIGVAFLSAYGVYRVPNAV